MSTRFVGVDPADPWLAPSVKSKAVQARIDDAAGNYASGDVEGALAELVDLVDAIVVNGGGLPPASTVDTITGGSTARAVTPNAREGAASVIDPRKYGFATTATGAVNSAALQAAIDEACGAVYSWSGTAWTLTTAAPNPVTTTRTAKRRVEIPAGTYLLDSPITVRSVTGLDLRGVGYVDLRANTAMASFLDINGAAYSTFSNFTLTGTTGVQVDIALYTYWDAAGSQRTNTANHYSDITIKNLDFVTGVQVGVPGLSVQVDDDTWVHIIVNGLWATGQASRYQYGMHIGPTAGNNLTHFVYHLRCQNIRYGLFNEGSQVALFGGGFAGGEVALQVGAAGFNFFCGIRCETHERLLATTTGSSNPPMITLSDVVYAATNMNADREWVQFMLGGVMRLTNVTIKYVAGTAPKIRVAPGGGGASLLIVSGLTVAGDAAPYAVASLFTIAAGGEVQMVGYVGRDVAGHAISVESYNSKPPVSVLAGYGPTVLGLTNEYWSFPGTRTTTAVAAGILYLHTVFVPRTCTINRIGAEATVAAAGSTMTLGVYSDDGAGSPGAVLLDAGTIDTGIIGPQEKTVSQVLIGPNVYHFAALCAGGTPTMRTIGGTWSGRNNSLGNSLNGTARPGLSRGGVSGTALPNPAGGGGPASGIPVVSVRLG